MKKILVVMTSLMLVSGLAFSQDGTSKTKEGSEKKECCKKGGKKHCCKKGEKCDKDKQEETKTSKM